MIDTFFNILRKTVVGTIAVIFAFVIIYTPQNFNDRQTVPTAEAFIVKDIAHTIISSIGYALQATLIIKETVLDAIAWVIAKNIMASMLTDLIDWVNKGFEGEPAFVTDFDKFITEVSDDAFGEYLEELGGEDSFLCSPTKLDIQVAIAEEYEQIKADQPYQYEGCSLEGIEDLEEFLDGDFSEGGGWEAWRKITSEPGQYTPYGQLMTAKQGLQNKLLNTQDKERTQVDWGNGFKPTKTCKTNSLVGGGTEEKCKVSLPGTILKDMLPKQLGSGQDALAAADEISEVIGALISQIANKAITGSAGLLGLSSDTGFTYEGFTGGSYTSAATSEGTGQGSATLGLSTIKDSLSVQQDYKALADSSALTLQTYISNPRNPAEKRQAAQVYLREVQAVQQNAPGYITKLSELVASYEKLETEYSNTNTSAQRKSAIRQEQMNIMNKYSTVGAYTKAQLEGSRASWNTASF